MKQTNTKRTIIHWLPVFGCMATGIIYAGIGVVALLSFFKFRNGGADEGSLLAIFNDYVIGKVLIGFILLGTSHIHPDGQPVEEREMAHQLLQSNGQWPVAGIGFAYLVTAIIQLWYGVTQGYRERVDIERFSSLYRHIVHLLAWAGYAARGIILGITGFFFLKAGFANDARFVVNTDKAFDFIGDDVGHAWFILVAVATFCYGLFMFAQGMAYDTDRDEAGV